MHDFSVPYDQLVGGVFAIRTDHFLRVNGYSNLYWGWGAEDDDMAYRYAVINGCYFGVIHILYPDYNMSVYVSFDRRRRLHDTR